METKLRKKKIQLALNYVGLKQRTITKNGE